MAKKPTYFETLLSDAWMALRPFVRHGKFTLRSGKESDIYLDIKGALLTKNNRALVTALHYIVTQWNHTIECFIGYGYGGALLCSNMAHYGFDSIVFRGEKKDYGLKNKPMGRCLI